MRRAIRTGCSAVAAFVMAAAAMPAAAAKSASKVPADLEKRVSEIEAVFNQQDAKKFAAFFTADGSFINPRGQRATGRGEVESRIAEDFEGPLKGSSSQYRIESARLVSPNLALLDLELEISGPNLNLPPSVPQPARAHGVALMQKTGGKWMIVAMRPYFFVRPPEDGAAASGAETRGSSEPTESQRGSSDAPTTPQR